MQSVDRPLFNYYLMNDTASIAAEIRARPIPTTLLRVFGVAIFANLADTAAPKRVNIMQSTRMRGLEMPPFMAKWETEPVKAVKVIMKTLVPTAVLSS